MAIKYHPDKVTHLGEDFQKMAEEKFKQLNESFGLIKKERGMNQLMVSKYIMKCWQLIDDRRKLQNYKVVMAQS